MIVSWKDDKGVTRWGDDNGKDYRQHLASKRDEKPAPKPAVVTPTVEVEAKRK